MGAHTACRGVSPPPRLHSRLAASRALGYVCSWNFLGLRVLLTSVRLHLPSFRSFLSLQTKQQDHLCVREQHSLAAPRLSSLFKFQQYNRAAASGPTSAPLLHFLPGVSRASLYSNNAHASRPLRPPSHKTPLSTDRGVRPGPRVISGLPPTFPSPSSLLSRRTRRASFLRFCEKGFSHHRPSYPFFSFIDTQSGGE